MSQKRLFYGLVSTTAMLCAACASMPLPETAKVIQPVTETVSSGSESAVVSAEKSVIDSRVASYPKGDSIRDFDWFQPQETVRGAWLGPITLAESKVQRNATAQKAFSYAVEQDSNALLVWQGDALRAAEYGSGYGPDDRTWSHSMHKSVVGLLVGIAVDKGFIESIDDPAGRYLTEWMCGPHASVTIRQLLSMTSGLQNSGNAIDGMPFGLKLGFSNDIERVALSAAQADKPGTYFQYNNANPQVLVSVLERVTGRRYSELLSEWLWQPIGARDAILWMDREGGAPHAANSLGATPADWLRIGLLILNDGRVSDRQVVSERWIRQMTEASTLNPNYGLLVWRGSPAGNERSFGKDSTFSVKHSEPFLVDDMVYLDGVGGQRVYISEKLDLVIVRTGATRMDWDDAIIPNAVIRALSIESFKK